MTASSAVGSYTVKVSGGYATRGLTLPDSFA
jgi:hypothetical protein